jgi:hypothetical protein
MCYYLHIMSGSLACFATQYCSRPLATSHGMYMHLRIADRKILLLLQPVEDFYDYARNGSLLGSL